MIRVAISTSSCPLCNATRMGASGSTCTAATTTEKSTPTHKSRFRLKRASH